MIHNWWRTNIYIYIYLHFLTFSEDWIMNKFYCYIWMKPLKWSIICFSLLIRLKISRLTRKILTVNENNQINNSKVIYTRFPVLYHSTNVFTNCSMNIDQLVFKLLEVTLVYMLVRKSLKFLLLGNQWTIGTVFKLLSWWNFFDVISYWKITSLEWLSFFHIPDNRHCITVYIYIYIYIYHIIIFS
jgi:hypothetical protein